MAQQVAGLVARERARRLLEAALHHALQAHVLGGHHLHRQHPVGDPAGAGLRRGHHYDDVLLGQVGRHAAEHALIPPSLRIQALPEGARALAQFG
jgi:hypothetical protein